MAQWDRILSRGRVVDRRGMGPLALGGGGLGIGGIALFLLLSYLGGGDMTGVLTQLASSQVPVQSMNAAQFEGADSYETFVATVLGSNNDLWRSVFVESNATYEEPTVVLYRDYTNSACGGASSLVGPHYCPYDGTIYIDETFFDELQSRFGARGGDVAEAYVISHEVGHHVQNILGILDDSNTSPSQQESIQTELQADCFAGLWAYSIKDQGVFEHGEIIEALDAASAVGDDRIQETIEGRVTPENWTHGSSAQRVAWFNRGYESGSVSACGL